MTAPLLRVAVRPPAERSDYAGAHWAQPVDFPVLLEQHTRFVELLHEHCPQVEILHAAPDLPDSCFTYDPAFVIPSGVIELRAAKPARADEPSLLTAELEALGLPVVGRLTGSATADGGDMFWLDEGTLAVGRSYRTNSEAVEQLRAIVADDGVRIETFDLAHDHGPEYCLHLMSVVSPVREDLAVVYERLAPVPLLQALQSRGIGYVSVPDEDYRSLGCNVLAVRPGVVILARGNDATVRLLREQGVEVHEYDASEINRGEGGPTCLTRPILRRAL